MVYVFVVVLYIVSTVIRTGHGTFISTAMVTFHMQLGRCVSLRNEYFSMLYFTISDIDVKYTYQLDMFIRKLRRYILLIMRYDYINRP